MLDYDATPGRYSAGTQLAFLLMLTGIGLVAGGFVTAYIAGNYLNVPAESIGKALQDTTDTKLLRALQCISTFLVMALPAMAFGLIMHRKPLQYLGFNSAISGKQVFLITVMLIMALAVSSSLSFVNEMIPISKSLESYFKSLEAQYNKQMFAIANMKTVQDYLLSLLIIALLPAIFEEMLFRGALQPVLISITRHAFVGILLTGILFSAIHFSYYGFLPRIALGMVLGYIFYFSKNLWQASLLHFLYNALGVTQLYSLSQKGALTAQAMNEDLVSPYYGLLAAAAIVAAFIVFKRESQVVISMYNYRKRKF